MSLVSHISKGGNLMSEHKDLTRRRVIKSGAAAAAAAGATPYFFHTGLC